MIKMLVVFAALVGSTPSADIHPVVETKLSTNVPTGLIGFLCNPWANRNRLVGGTHPSPVVLKPGEGVGLAFSGNEGGWYAFSEPYNVGLVRCRSMQGSDEDLNAWATNTIEEPRH